MRNEEAYKWQINIENLNLMFSFLSSSCAILKAKGALKLNENREQDLKIY